jgi:hypothetical protein
MKNYIFAILMMVLLSACSSSDVKKATEQAQTNYNTCQKDYYAASEIVKVELTDEGKVKSMAVGNQNLVPCQIAKAPKSAAVAMVEVIGNVTNTALNVAASSVPYIAISKIAVDGIKGAGNNTYNSDSFNSHSEANQANQQTTTTSTETVNGIKANGNVDQSQHNQNNPNTETTTNTDNNSVNDSNNSNDDNSTTESTTPVDTPVADDL